MSPTLYKSIVWSIAAAGLAVTGPLWLAITLLLPLALFAFARRKVLTPIVVAAVAGLVVRFSVERCAVADHQESKSEIEVTSAAAPVAAPLLIEPTAKRPLDDAFHQAAEADATRVRHRH